MEERDTDVSGTNILNQNEPFFLQWLILLVTARICIYSIVLYINPLYQFLDLG